METTEKIMDIVERYEHMEGSLIPILHEVQELYGYIPYGAQEIIARELKIPLSDIYGVITFYSRFTLKPAGKCKISVCLGTACYIKGAEDILNAVKKHLGIDTGETTADGLFSIEETRCVGACGLAPIVTINKDVYGKVTPEQIEGILSKYCVQE